mgnify:CR=1 FL=1
MKNGNHPLVRRAMWGRVRKVHLVGIGGAGMSGIAEVLLASGYQVSGSDLKESEVTQRLRELGGKIYYGHKAEQIGDAEVKGVQRTKVRYIPLYKDEAFVLGIPFSKNAELVEDPYLKDLEVLIEVGCEYRP